jgi:hypothetical protein
MTYPMICVDCQNYIIHANHANSNIFLICNPCELQHKRHTASSTESASSSKASHGFGSSMANDAIWMKRCKEGIHVFLEAFRLLMFLVPSEFEQKKETLHDFDCSSTSIEFVMACNGSWAGLCLLSMKDGFRPCDHAWGMHDPRFFRYLTHYE